MAEAHTGGCTSVSQVIEASAEAVYAAFMDPAALIVWLPPGDMTGRIDSFEGKVGGGYEMSLFYPPSEQVLRGKTAALEDWVRVRFTELTPPRRIVEAVTFLTSDPAFLGEMTIVVSIADVSGGSEVTIACSNLPPGVRPADNEAGSRQSLAQLARRFERQTDGI